MTGPTVNGKHGVEQPMMGARLVERRHGFNGPSPLAETNVFNHYSKSSAVSVDIVMFDHETPIASAGDRISDLLGDGLIAAQRTKLRHPKIDILRHVSTSPVMATGLAQRMPIALQRSREPRMFASHAHAPQPRPLRRI
jgi:hypothetical protein